MERRKKVRDSHGVETEGIVVGVVESTERWSDVLLEDGTRLSVKVNIAEAIRIDNDHDADGNPVYAIASSLISRVVDIDEKYKRK